MKIPTTKSLRRINLIGGTVSLVAFTGMFFPSLGFDQSFFALFLLGLTVAGFALIWEKIRAAKVEMPKWIGKTDG